MAKVDSFPVFKVQIPANNETLSITSSPDILSEDSVSQIKAGSAQIYYVFYVIDEKQQVLFEFCGRLDGNLNFAYCGFHNGP